MEENMGLPLSNEIVLRLPKPSVGTNGKIILTNFQSVANQLGHPASYFRIFLHSKLGCKSGIETKKRRGLILEGISMGRLINGEIDRLVTEYSDKFVFCFGCKTSTMTLKIDDSKNTDQLIVQCKTCQEQNKVIPQNDSDLIAKLKEAVKSQSPSVRRSSRKTRMDSYGGSRPRPSTSQGHLNVSPVCGNALAISPMQFEDLDEEENGNQHDENMDPEPSPNSLEDDMDNDEMPSNRHSSPSSPPNQQTGVAGPSHIELQKCVDGPSTKTRRKSVRLQMWSKCTSLPVHEKLGETRGGRVSKKKNGKKVSKVIGKRKTGNYVTHKVLKKSLKPFVTKKDLEKSLKPFVTKKDLKKSLKPFVTKKDLKKSLDTMFVKIENMMDRKLRIRNSSAPL